MKNIQLHLLYQKGKKSYQHQFSIQENQPKQSFKLENINLTMWIQVDRWQVELHTNGFETIVLKKINITFLHPFSDSERWLCNGYQSWTETKEYDRQTPIKSLRKIVYPIMKQFGDYAFHPANQPQHWHSWIYSYIKEKNADKLDFFGSLHEKNGYTFITYSTDNQMISISKDVEGLHLKGEETYLALDFLYLQNVSEKAAFDQYFKQQKLPKPTQKPTAGWTSWYNYYTSISESIILQNLAAFAERKVPISLFQIDDGWQNAVGDWLVSNSKFGRGMGFLTHKIHEQDYKAGLWLAPFICEKKSVLFRQHQDWLLKDEKGRLVTAGYNAMWLSPMYILNLELAEVRDYLRKVFDLILRTWAFDMVKVDFLYAAALHPPKHKTRGQVMFEAMEFLRKVVGEDKIILACGVPLGATFGLADYCRIGADIHTAWEMGLLKILGNRERVSTILALQNTIFRHQLNGQVFWNDPDVSILRNYGHSLTEEQRKTLFLINQIFGSLQFISDDIRQYDEATMALYLSQFPIKKREVVAVKWENLGYEIHFELEGEVYVAFCNLGKEIFSKKLEEAYFWEAEKRLLEQGMILELKAYESVCLKCI